MKYRTRSRLHFKGISPIPVHSHVCAAVAKVTVEFLFHCHFVSIKPSSP